jgi:hypothetical protein
MISPSLSVPAPCTQPWETMTPAAHGRHCAACEKVVTDFTHFTDAELLAWLRQQKDQASCGRFRADQLGRELRLTVVPRARSWQKWLATTIAMWGLRETAAITSKAQIPIEQRERAGEPISIADYVQKPVVIRGVLTDSTSHERLPGVLVSLAETSNSVITNQEGEFELVIPVALWELSTKQLVLSYIGYTTRRVAAPIVTDQPLPLTLSADIQGLTAVVVTGYYTPSHSSYTRPSLWQRLKRLVR